jgi:hypothetical protein
MKARFGRLGRISVQFNSDSGLRLVPIPKGNCRGRGEIVDRGHWVGRIEFDGEEEYTTFTHLGQGKDHQGAEEAKGVMASTFG